MSSGLDDRKDGGKGGAGDVMSLDDGGDEKKLRLVSSEGEKFEVSKKVAVQSELVKTMAEGDKEENEIPLPNVKASVLRKVVEYMKYHVDNPAREIEKPLKSANMAEVVSQWDAGQSSTRTHSAHSGLPPSHALLWSASVSRLFTCVDSLLVLSLRADFVDVDQEVLFELILAANYMDVKALLDLCCAKVASMMKGKTAEQIRKTFNIVNDFTPEEEAAIIAENKSHALPSTRRALTKPTQSHMRTRLHSTVRSHTPLCVAHVCRWAEES